MCDFENIILQPMKYDNVDATRRRNTVEKQFENCLFLPLPTERPRRSSLPSHKERHSPSLSPRRLFDFIKVSVNLVSCHLKNISELIHSMRFTQFLKKNTYFLLFIYFLVLL